MPDIDISHPEGQTDLANARRLIHLHGDKLRFCHPFGKWFVWDFRRWKTDDDGAVERLAKSVADAVWADARESNEPSALRHAARTASDRGVRAMLSLASSDLPVLPGELDSNPALLNVENGTVDLRTGRIRDHKREDMLTKIAPVALNNEASSFAWDRFLEDVFAENQDVIPFVQRLFGYCATGDVREQILGILWGCGANGKTTLIDAITSTLGPDYACSAPKDLLMAKRGDSHPCEIADLFAKRLVISNETEHSRTLAEGLVKQLTGGDKIKARRMREDFWEFAPSHKLLVLTNHRPRVRGIDHAIWRRIRLIPFNSRFEGDTRDKAMPAKLAAERAGILAWIIRGAVDWYATGLADTPTVTDATAEYRASSDVIGRFLSDCFHVAPDMRVKFSDLMDRLEHWCRDGGDNLPSRKFVGEYLQDRGFTAKTSNGRWYLGLAERTDA